MWRLKNLRLKGAEKPRGWGRGANSVRSEYYGGYRTCSIRLFSLTSCEHFPLLRSLQYEEQKLKKFPDNVRLACMAVVEGEAKVEVEG